MSFARFRVSFGGDAPDELKVGDKLTISGQVTVQSISADLINITSLGHDPEFTLGQVEISLAANRLEIAR